MKILICSDIYPGLAGIARYVREFSAVLSKYHSVVILAGRRDGEKEREIIDSIEVVRVDKGGIDDFMSKNEFDLIIAKHYSYLLPASKYHDKVLYVVPSIKKSSYMSMGKVGKKVNDMIEAEKEGMKNVGVIYPSNLLKKQAKKDYGINKGIVLPHGINIETFGPGKNKKYDVLTVSNLNDRRKGIDKLINVAKNSIGKFFVLGDGELREGFELSIKKGGIADRVKLLGRKDSTNYFKQSKVFVLPSRYEAFGIVLLEAMASGLPCIAFKPDGKNILTASDEIIENGKTGFLVKDEDEMSKKIDLLLSDAPLLEKMGKAARKVAEKYSWDKYYIKFMDILKNENLFS